MLPIYKKLLLVFVLFISILSGAAVTAQNIPGEADTEAFLNANFQFQDMYSRVLCVSQDNSCPSEISTVVPCLTAACAHPEQNYPVGETFATIQAASDSALPGDLIIITPGRYRGVEVEETGGESGAYIHFLGWGEPGSVIVDTPADPDKGYLRHHFYFINTHHYIIQNLAFENADRGAGIFFSGYFSETGSFAHHMVVMDVYSHDNGEWGMHSTATSYVVVQDSIFTNSVYEHGLYLSGSGDNIVVRRNVFQGNIASGLQINPDPQTATMELFYWLDNSTGDVCGWSEDDVDFTGSATWHDLKTCYDGQNLPDLGEFIEDGVSTNLIIEQNVMIGNGNAGGGAINLASIRDSVVRNNLIYGNAAAGITCWDNGYAEEKGLDSSEFGCHDVVISNNTIVDGTGNRGALILNNDASDMQVFNNIIIRDRFDAYEIANRSGQGLLSGSNYYSARYVEDSPAASDEIMSITGFSVDEGLAQFVAPGFALWLVEIDGWMTLNPARPDYHLRPDSILLTTGNVDYSPAYDLNNNQRAGTEVGALGPGELIIDGTTTDTASEPSATILSGGHITYTLPDDRAFLSSTEANAVAIDIGDVLDTMAPGWDGWLNISPDGQWLLLESERFDPECDGWACLMVTDTSLTTPEIIKADGQVIHPEGFSAVASGGHLVIFVANDGPNDLDLFATTRLDSGWSTPRLLTSDSPYSWHQQPAISANGLQVIFDCGDESYGDMAICEVNVDGSNFRIILTSDNPPEGMPAGSGWHHPDYAPDGSIVLEGDWGGETIWHLPLNASEPVMVNGVFNNDNSPCVLPDGRIVSLWLDRPDAEGFHEIKVMNSDGSEDSLILRDIDVLDVGIGCGG
jgi:hypothetical protein